MVTPSGGPRPIPTKAEGAGRRSELPPWFSATPTASPPAASSAPPALDSAAAAAARALAQRIYADMEHQFELWDGSEKSSDAFWGARYPGSAVGAQRVSAEVSKELETLAAVTGWKRGESDSGSPSLCKRRPASRALFLYHLAPP